MIEGLKAWVFKKKRYSKHILFLLYSFLFFILFLGVLNHSGTRYIRYLGLYYLVFFISYYLFSAPLFKKRWLTFWEKVPSFKGSSVLFLAVTAVFIVFHYVYMGSIPIFMAAQSLDDIEVAKIRNEVTVSSPFWLNYASSFFLKAIMPVFILLIFLKDKKYVIPMAVICSFYAMSLIQKSYIVTLFIPLGIYFLIYRKWTLVLGLTLFVTASLLFLVHIANPEISNIPTVAGKSDKVEEVQYDSPIVSYVYGIYKRVVIIPGKMVSLWFQYIPSEFPYRKACGYHFLAPVLSCQYTSYSRAIYDEEYPEMKQAGIPGTCVSAHFMEDYANFGAWGLIFSAILLGLFFNILSTIFNSSADLLIYNTYPTLILTSSAFSTLLLSHGWILIILLYLTFVKDNQ